VRVSVIVPVLYAEPQLLGATPIYRIGERGFGSALRRGFAEASGEGMVPIMGDASEDPEALLRLVREFDRAGTWPPDRATCEVGGSSATRRSNGSLISVRSSCGSPGARPSTTSRTHSRSIDGRSSSRSRLSPIRWTYLLSLLRHLWRICGEAGDPPIVHEPALSVDVQRRVPNVSKIESRLGWTARVPLAEGLRRTVDWYVTQGRTPAPIVP
jgi:hypothetical protein